MDNQQEKLSDDQIAELRRFVENGNFTPSGNENEKEDGIKQRENSIKVERYYRYLVRCSGGHDDREVLEVFFKLFDTWIGLYELDKCDKELSIIVPICRRRGGDFMVKGLQSLAFVRWKQSRFEESKKLFEEIDRIIGPSAIHYENMAHTYNTMGDYAKAEDYFRRALDMQTSNRAGVYLGLGLIYERQKKYKEALDVLLRAHEMYKDKFYSSDSSLVAKSGLSVAKCYHKMGNMNEAEKYARESVRIFKETCGENHPLVAGARKELGDLMKETKQYDQARICYKHAFIIEAEKDSIDLIALIELVNGLINVVSDDPKLDDKQKATRYDSYEKIADKSIKEIDKRLKLDANVGAYYKTLGIMFFIAKKHQKCIDILVRATELFNKEPTTRENEEALKTLKQECDAILASAIKLLGENKSVQ